MPALLAVISTWPDTHLFPEGRAALSARLGSQDAVRLQLMHLLVGPENRPELPITMIARIARQVQQWDKEFMYDIADDHPCQVPDICNAYEYRQTLFPQREEHTAYWSSDPLKFGAILARWK